MFVKKLVLLSAFFGGPLSTIQAQLLPGTVGKGGTGTYVLVNNRQKHYSGALKVFQEVLIAKDEQGKISKWRPEEVYYVRGGSQRFVTATGFTIKSGFGQQTINNRVFVELLDSGKVSLMSFQYAPGNGSVLKAYLLQDATEEEATTIPYSIYTDSGKRFREAVAPYVSARPDLIKLLTEGIISVNNLAAFIHALNTGQPFISPPVSTTYTSY